LFDAAPKIAEKGGHGQDNAGFPIRPFISVEDNNRGLLPDRARVVEHVDHGKGDVGCGQVLTLRGREYVRGCQQVGVLAGRLLKST
jgi:hypothetical protein